MLIKKCIFAYYNLLFKLYGKLGRKCLAKVRENPAHADVWFKIADWCIYKRQDILQALTKLTGLY